MLGWIVAGVLAVLLIALVLWLRGLFSGMFRNI
jgi:hypothetical protein